MVKVHEVAGLVFEVKVLDPFEEVEVAFPGAPAVVVPVWEHEAVAAQALPLEVELAALVADLLCKSYG